MFLHKFIVILAIAERFICMNVWHGLNKLLWQSVHQTLERAATNAMNMNKWRTKKRWTINYVDGDGSNDAARHRSRRMVIANQYHNRDRLLGQNDWTGIHWSLKSIVFQLRILLIISMYVLGHSNIKKYKKPIESHCKRQEKQNGSMLSLMTKKHCGNRSRLHCLTIRRACRERWGS